MIGRKGLFGRGVPAMPGVISGYGGGTFDMDGMPVTMPDMQNVPTTAGGRFGNPMPAQMQEPARPKSFWQGGDKFTVRDGIAGALAAIGDGLSGWAGGGVGAVGGLLQGRMEPQRLAEEQRRRAAELADYRTKLGIQREMEGEQGPELGTFEDNAGNVWSFDKRTNQVVGDKPFFVDQTQRTMIQDGALIRVPNPYATAAAGQSGGQQGGYSEGTMIENDQGQRMVLRNGKWEPVSGGTSGNAGGNFRP